MITIESNAGTEQDIADAMKMHGIEPEVVAPVVEGEKPAEEKKSAEPGAPGEKVPAEPGKGSEAVTEPAKDKSEEKPPEQQVTPPAETPEAKEKKAKGGFQIKVEKLTKTVDLLQTQLEAKDGNEARLRRELEEAQAALAKLKPAEPEKASEPVMPIRPKLKDFDFDQDKYDAALDEHEKKVHAYHAEIRANDKQEIIKAEREDRAREQREAQTAKAMKDFEDRRNQSKEAYDDFDELMTALPKEAETLVDRSRVVADYIQFKSKDPAHLIHFLMKDFLEGDEAEAERFMKMDDYDQLIEIKALEDKLIREHKKESKAKADEPAPVVETPPAKKAAEVATPEKEKQPRAKVPDEPIAPVGNSAPATGKDLNEQMKTAAAAGDSREYRRLFDLQQKERQAARA